MGIHLKVSNKSGLTLHVAGSKGSDWGKSVDKGETILSQTTVDIGEISEASSPSSDHWGWIYLSVENEPIYQIYIRDGTSSMDYAVQYYDEGNNRNGTTISNTSVKKTNSNGKTVITFTIKKAFKLNKWIGAEKFKDKHLHQLTIPGTHDSATYKFDHGSISQCQEMSLHAQLVAGVRYFDIRFDGDDFKIVHGGIHGSSHADLTMEEVAKIFKKYIIGSLKDEVIVVQLKDDRGNTKNLHSRLKQVWDSAFETHAANHLYWKPIRYQFSPIPTIHDLKGKVVIIRRYETTNENADEQEGSEAATPIRYLASGEEYVKWDKHRGGKTWHEKFEETKFVWPDGADNETYFGHEGSMTDYRNYHGLSFAIQDVYDLGSAKVFKNGSVQKTSITKDDKADLVKKYMNFANHGNPDTWFINFSSCTETLKDPINYANHINPKLSAALSHLPSGSYGTILIDYADADLIQAIINKNA